MLLAGRQRETKRDRDGNRALRPERNTKTDQTGANGRQQRTDNFALQVELRCVCACVLVSERVSANGCVCVCMCVVEEEEELLTSLGLSDRCAKWLAP